MSYRICPLSDHVTGVLDGQRLKRKTEFCWEDRKDVENTFKICFQRWATIS